MKEIKIYHNPRCSKSREALKYLNDKGLNLDIILYTKNTLSKYEAVFPRVDYRRGRDIGNLGRHLPSDNRKGALVNQYVMRLPRSQQPQYLKPESFYCSSTNLRVSDQSPTCKL